MPQAFELRLIKHDETVIWARLNTTTLHDAADTPVFRVVLSDITEHRMAVEALRQSELRESENRFRKLFEQHSAVKLVLDAETGGIIDANEAAVTFYGWPTEKLKQMNIEEINTLPPEDMKAELKKAALSGNAGFEVRHRRADDSIRDEEVFSNTIESAGRDYLYLIIHDITERKWAEQILMESEARFQLIFQDVFSIAVQGYEPDGTTKYWNHASELLYGYSMQEAVGRNLLDLIIPQEIRGDIEQAIRRMAETGRPIPASELSLMRKDGSRVAVLSNHAVFQLPNRKPELFCIDIDLTELKNTEQALYENEQRLRLFI
jgi:PAS domain S-box-containing protein